MASGDYSFSPPAYTNSPMDWSVDTSQFLYDSPQPDPQTLPSMFEEEQTRNRSPYSSSFVTTNQASQQVPLQQQHSQQHSQEPALSHVAVQHDSSSALSTVSEDSSHSSSSVSSVRTKRKTSSTSPQTVSFAVEDVNARSLVHENMEKTFGELNSTYQFDDPTFPTMGQDLNNLSLNGTFGSGSIYGPILSGPSLSPSPQMTVQPSKTTFKPTVSREDSPMFNSQASSPTAFFSSDSPDAFGNGLTVHVNGLGFDSNSMGFSGILPGSTFNGHIAGTRPNPASRWPCLLTIEDTPEKSRVETQIPIKMTLHNVPSGVTRLHLPAYTISKPKFQAKPPFIPSADTLELCTMLVCASALQRDGVEEQAFHRAASELEPVKEEDMPSSNDNQVDENDARRPLNGGPVAICQGCIVRERKRAARKKTKKVEEEEEWAKDEAKRIIVFNCPEVRDWCLPGPKQILVKDHDGPRPDILSLEAPMRIACYCRHQTEKVGFQVIFTIKTWNGQILAQAISNSIMITDDHKQPMPNQGVMSHNTSPTAGQVPGSGVFTSGPPSGLYPAHVSEMPFRHSWSTPNLHLFGNSNTYTRQPQRPNFQRHLSGGFSQQSTASATPRNLSRPASPTDPSGHSTKKRKSGSSPHHKLPPALTMTSIDSRNAGVAVSSSAAGPFSAGVPSTGFSFTSPASGTFGSPMDQQVDSQSRGVPNYVGNGVSTPKVVQGFGPSPVENPYQFYSAPTSQHPSRAPSPTLRMAGAPLNNDTVEALASLPAGINMQRPPIIQRLIPSTGPRCGGDEVTVLGSGFCQGLEVMFGDARATNTTYWGDTTLVCRAPPSARSGAVAVVFQHQHHSAPSALQEVPGLFAGYVQVMYKYFDDERSQSRGLPIGMPSQRKHEGHSPNQDHSGGFFRNQHGYPSFQRMNSGGIAPQQQRSPQHYTGSTVSTSPFNVPPVVPPSDRGDRSVVSGAFGSSETPPAYTDLFPDRTAAAQENGVSVSKNEGHTDGNAKETVDRSTSYRAPAVFEHHTPQSLQFRFG